MKTALGLTAAKKRVKKDLGIYEITKLINTRKNAVRRAKRAVGYESEGMKFFRFLMSLFGGKRS